MPHYRLYFINGQDHIERAVNIDAMNDETAVAEARAHRGNVVEIWDRGRRVARLNSTLDRRYGGPAPPGR